MNTGNIRRYFLYTISSLFTVAVLTACGGGGSSSSGSGGITAGSATLSGNINSGIAFNTTLTPSQRLWAGVLSLAVSEASAAGVDGVTVELLKNGGVVGSQVTDGSGNFLFAGLAPGSYTVQLSQGGQRIGVSPPIQLDANTRTRLDMGVNGKLASVEIEAQSGKIVGEVENKPEQHEPAGNDDGPNESSEHRSTGEDAKEAPEKEDHRSSDNDAGHNDDKESASRDDDHNDSRDDNHKEDSDETQSVTS